jgi:Putative zinc-finger
MSELRTVEALYLSVLGKTPHLPDELLLRAVEERLTPREQSRVEAHLAACTRCRQDFQALRHFAERQSPPPTPTLVLTEERELPKKPTELPRPEEETPPPPPSIPVLRVVESSPPPRATPAPKPTTAPRPETLSGQPPYWLVVTGLFLALNALGLGALYRRYQPTPRPIATPPMASPGAPGAAASSDIKLLQAAYERERAQLRGKIGLLEKQLQGRKQATSDPAPAQRAVATSALFSPRSIAVDRTPYSLTVHPMVTWVSTPRAHHYTTELFDEGNKQLIKTQTTLPEWRIATALTRGKRYRWKITPQDRSNKALRGPLTGSFTVASEQKARRLQTRLTALAAELASLNFTGDAQALRARAAMIEKK